jgi:hypothetical protein
MNRRRFFSIGTHEPPNAVSSRPEQPARYADTGLAVEPPDPFVRLRAKGLAPDQDRGSDEEDSFALPPEREAYWAGRADEAENRGRVRKAITIRDEMAAKRFGATNEDIAALHKKPPAPKPPRPTRPQAQRPAPRTTTPRVADPVTQALRSAQKFGSLARRAKGRG